MRDSIIQKEKECWLCKSTQNLERHHVIFGTANRKNSDKYGLTVYLCHDHHTGTNHSVHMNIAIDYSLKQEAQKAFEKSHTREEFIQIFGRNYL